MVDCYCSDNDGRCLDYVFDGNCKILLENSFQQIVEASYVLGVISVIVTVCYAILTCSVCCSTDRAAVLVEDQHAVPTVAVIEPTVVAHDVDVNISVVNHNDDFNQNDEKVVTAQAVHVCNGADA